MCGRLTQPSAEHLGEDMDLFFNRPAVMGRLATHGPNEDVVVTPGKVINVILEAGDDSSITVTSMHWGYPSGEEKNPLWYNARIETADVKPTWKEDYAYRRCLIPVSTFTEGDVTFQAFDDTPMFMAGVFTRQSHRVGEINFRDVSMLTKPALGMIKNYSDRAPVICPTQQGLDWLRRDSIPNAIRTSVLAHRPRLIVVG